MHLYEKHDKTLWEHFGLLNQIEQVHSREVLMPSGGRLVFDQTEALMAIDINSGKIGGKTNFEAMAFRTNMEAATAIARQLRLRDIGGRSSSTSLKCAIPSIAVRLKKNSATP